MIDFYDADEHPTYDDLCEGPTSEGQAFDVGYLAADQGAQSRHNPYTNPELRRAWRRGWNDWHHINEDDA